jgi:hypothetical protein
VGDHKIKPGRWVYALAGLIFVSGWVGFAAILFTNLSGIGKKLQQVVVPGKSAITLHEAGSYTIFHEYRSVVGGKVYSTEKELPGLECELVSKSTGARVPLTPATTNGTYEMGGRAGVSIFDFSIHDPGEYELSATYSAGQQGPEAVLAVGQDFTLGIITTVFGSLAVVFGCILISIALAITALIMRSNAKKRLKAAGTTPITPIQG